MCLFHTQCCKLDSFLRVFQIKTFPRVIEDSLRRKDEKRKRKREERKKRKEEQLVQKRLEVKRLKKQKREELMEKINKLKELTGNDTLGFDVRNIYCRFLNNFL